MTSQLTLLVGGVYHATLTHAPEATGYQPFVIDPPAAEEGAPGVVYYGRFRVFVHESLLDIDRADDLRRSLLDAALHAAGLPQADVEAPVVEAPVEAHVATVKLHQGNVRPGWFATCSCGWEGPARRTDVDAHFDCLSHGGNGRKATA